MIKFLKIIIEIENLIYSILKHLPGFLGKFIRRAYLNFFIKLGKNFNCETGFTLKGHKNITINDNCKIGYNNFFSADNNGKIIIGNNFASSSNVTINASNDGNIEIGNNVLIAPNVVIRASDHIYNKKNTTINQSGHKFGKIIIGNDVWIGANSVILKNVKIKDGSIIGAGTVVTKDVEQDTIVVGNNQKILKKRFV